jgi:hypothetical protein
LPDNVKDPKSLKKINVAESIAPKIATGIFKRNKK